VRVQDEQPFEAHRLRIQQSVGSQHQDARELRHLGLCGPRGLEEGLHQPVRHVEPGGDCIRASLGLHALLRLRGCTNQEHCFR
ncbi:unnamed protein product, partial [Effrenium voratum]